MRSTASRKAWRDLSRKRTRSILTMLTLALAVASIGMLAVPSLLDRAMRHEVRVSALYHIALPLRDTQLSDAQLAELRAIPNVTAVEARVSYPTRIRDGVRQVQATVWGVRDFADQRVDTVRVQSGRPPVAGELLGDSGNAKSMHVSTRAGDTVEILGPDGTVTPLAVSGAGRSLAFSQMAGETSNKHVVLYATNATVQSLSHQPGYNYLELRARNTTKAALDSTVATVTAWLDQQVGPNTLTDLPVTRPEADWPFRDMLQRVNSMFMILSALAVLTALFLIASTMNTLVTEQTTDIGIMKAVGGRRGQVTAILLRTAVILGAAAAVIGVAAGAVLAVAITRFFATDFFSVSAPFDVNIRVVVGSALFAVGLAVVAALPALRRALRVPVVQALESRGVASATFGMNSIDHALIHSRWLPRDARLGIRNLGRNKRRTITTAVQVGLSVALALGLLGLGTSLKRTLDGVYASLRYDATANITTGGRPLDATALQLAAATPGVAAVSPMLQNSVEYRGKSQFALGLSESAPYAADLEHGRWITEAEQRQAEHVVVIGGAIARRYALSVDDTITLNTAGGPQDFRVIAIDNNQMNNGSYFFLPLSTLQRLTGWHDAANGFWFTTTRHDQASVDLTTRAVEDRLTAAGYPIRTDELYVQQRDNAASNQAILDLVNVIGLIIVAISMVGLTTTITVSILERTREIGVLRCIGGRSRNIRRSFVAEGVAIGLLGWIVGLPLGWLLSRGLVAYMLHIFDVRIPALFPIAAVALVFCATIGLSAVIVLLPVRRATRLRPGDALRYV